ncbi:MAG: pyridoxal 5'-phosphate synthase glutaminase subunit PdxT [Ilumatobacteraceae bacterium]
MDPLVGVLALQGAFAAHERALTRLGVATRQVRTPEDLADVDAIVLPGGESTTMSHLLTTSGLFDMLDRRLADGMPVLGTCAGMILLASHVLDGRADQRTFGRVDVTVRRNGYGRQVDSFEVDLDIPELAAHGLGADPFHAVFIRAPKVESVGRRAEVLASHEGVPVLVADGPSVVAAFHPELTDDGRVHSLFLRRAAIVAA